MKYYEILPTHIETPRNTTRKIANLYIEFNYQFLTFQKKNPITFEQECTAHWSYDQVHFVKLWNAYFWRVFFLLAVWVVFL